MRPREPAARRARGLTAALLALAVAPAAAQAPPAIASATPALRQALEAARGDDCTGVLAALDPAVGAAPAGAERTMMQRMRLPCLAFAGREADLKAAHAELAGALPRDGMVRSFGVMIAASEDRFADAAELLAAMAESDPGSLRLVSGQSWRGIAQKLTEESRYDLRDRVFIALARADWQPQDQPELRDTLAQGAIEALLGRQETDEALRLLDRVEMPELLATMATERRYAPLWTDIERRMGPQGGDAIDRFARAKLEAYARSPDDARVTRDAVRAFVLLGRNAEAIELAERTPISDAMDEDAVAITRYRAHALNALGRRGAAIDLIAQVARLDVQRAPAAASAMVVHAELLDEAGRAEEAVAAARTYLARSGGALSPWGVAWLERTEVCGLAAMRRPADAAQALVPLTAAPERNQAATIEALLCAGRMNAAAALAITTLATAQGASLLADQFQPDGALGLPTASRLRALWGPLLARPDVKAAFAGAARILPRSLWPAPAPRPIPRARAPFANGPIA